MCGDAVPTGVTAILPHGGDLFADKVPAAVYVGNGFGKAAGRPESGAQKVVTGGQKVVTGARKW